MLSFCFFLLFVVLSLHLEGWRWFPKSGIFVCFIQTRLFICNCYHCNQKFGFYQCHQSFLEAQNFQIKSCFKLNFCKKKLASVPASGCIYIYLSITVAAGPGCSHCHRPEEVWKTWPSPLAWSRLEFTIIIIIIAVLLVRW